MHGGMQTVSAELDDEIKRKAEAVLKPLGVSSASVIQMMFARIAAEGTLPFELFQPNAETIAAMEAARRGEAVKIGNGTIDELFDWLHADHDAED